MYQTFDDVLLLPQYSDVKSRGNVNLGITIAAIGENKYIDVCSPIVSSNMDTVTGESLAASLAMRGNLAFLHRTGLNSPESLIHRLTKLKYQLGDRDTWIARVVPSIGVNQARLWSPNLINHVYDLGYKFLCIDTAHGDSLLMREAIEKLEKTDLKLIVGNIATNRAMEWISSYNHVWGVKVGIGPGSACTTRIITGHGVPQLSAIKDIALYLSTSRRKHKPIIIADGGIRNSGDIAKCLAVGAHFVMLGRLLSGTKEAPGEIIRRRKFITKFPFIQTKLYKKYRGMASRNAHYDLRGKYPFAPEGVEFEVPYVGRVSDYLDSLEHGLRSALSYSGAHNIQQFMENAKLIDVSYATVHENHPHGMLQQGQI